jgi:hypothetical protein
MEWTLPCDRLRSFARHRPRRDADLWTLRPQSGQWRQACTDRTMPTRCVNTTRLRIGTAAALGALALLSAAASFAAADAPDAASRFYKWVDAQGVVHYGDSVPPQFSQDSQDVLNGEGVRIDHIAGRETAAQLSADQQAAQQAADRAQHDKFLLTTYASSHEIEQLRDERLDQIDGQIKASAAYIDSLTLRLAALEDRAQHFAPYSSTAGAPRMPDDLAEELVRTSNEARLQRTALEAKRQSQTDMRVKFAADIERYRELTEHTGAGS